ncbi:MAG: NUDIX hydrolase [Candidatus Pacebacteria bacterium]|nr:NUDIX hydrolase [Candidatus Paceibacterota bacterium]
MAIPKEGKSKNGKAMHYSVGALIEEDGKYLLIDRVKPPFGFAGVAGHIDEGEEAEEALVREVKEESGLKVKGFKLLFEEEANFNTCRRGIEVHYWYLFKCIVKGRVKQNIEETKSIDWYTIEEIKKLELEPVWKYYFEKMGII